MVARFDKSDARSHQTNKQKSGTKIDTRKIFGGCKVQFPKVIICFWPGSTSAVLTGTRPDFAGNRNSSKRVALKMSGWNRHELLKRGKVASRKE
jgi:hypothetical protein